MNKKLNTALFFLAATVINLLIIFLLCLVLFVPWVIFVGRSVSGSTNLLALLLSVVLGTAGSFPIYRKLVNWFQSKVDFDQYFDPIVRQSNKKLRR